MNTGSPRSRGRQQHRSCRYFLLTTHSAMVALKSHQVDAFVAKPAQPVVLVFGPDSGLVRERAEALIRASVDDVNDPFSLARLDGNDLAAEPTRLVEEANTVPLFGGR